MKNCITYTHETKRRGLTLAAAAALALVAALPQPALAGRITPTPVPPELEVPAGNRAFLLGHATGTQNYVCLPAGTGFAWSLFTPQATLFDDNLRQLTTHFFGPNPAENGTIRAAWQHSKDTSTVWGAVRASSSDPRFVTPGAIPWLLVQTVGVEEGPGGGDRLTATSFIHRVKTVGGAAPTTGCAQLADVGKRAFVPYKADYVFYREHAFDAVEDEGSH
jgi:hypothetical protein